MKNISWVDGKDSRRRGLAEPIRQATPDKHNSYQTKKWIGCILREETCQQREVGEGNMAGKTQRATDDNDARVDVRSYIKEQA